MERPRVLNNVDEIAEYIEKTSTEGADPRMVRQLFDGCAAELKKLSVEHLIQCLDLDSIDPAKIRRAKQIDAESCDPIVVDGTIIWDGHERLIAAQEQGLESIWAYCIQTDSIH